MERNDSKRAHREIEFAQETARRGPNRIGEAWSVESGPLFSGTVEVDETCIGGRRKNMPKAERPALSGHGGVDKSIVAGTKDRAAEPVTAVVAEPEDSVSRSPAADLTQYLNGDKFGTVLADPPWRFANRTGKVAPEHRRLSRYGTLNFEEIAALPVGEFMEERAHCYLWVPNALLPHGLRVLESWGFRVQEQPDLAQDTKGRRFRRARGWVLFPERDRNRAVPASGGRMRARSLPGAARSI